VFSDINIILTQIGKYICKKMENINMAKNKRCSTGIPNLDKKLGGGFPPGPRTILVSGGCGTGKTTLGVQFVYKGVVDYKEPGILINFEQNISQLKEDMLNFGFDLQKLEDDNMLRIYDRSSAEEGKHDMISFLIEKAREIDAKRIVIDSMQTLEYLLGSEIQFTIASTCDALKRAGLTTLILAESRTNEIDISKDVESYIVDGVIILSIHEALDTRKLIIRKMRGTAHTLKPMEMRICKTGVEVD